ncbi:MAG: twin-arginine translocase subunit TatC [Saprospiraceae bacterium]|nr:twin-arginine translocase subunit TatC [Saprospiraceae bacterium]
MNFFEHLDELRSRLIRAIIAVVVGMIGTFVSGDWLFSNVVFAQLKPDFVTYRVMCAFAEKTGLAGLCIKAPKVEMMNIDMGEPFFKHMQFSFIMGIIIAIPYIIYQLWLFIKPGLMDVEMKAARGFVFICSSLFLFGVAFGYFVIAPFSIAFLAGYTIGGVGGNTTLSSYMGYMTMFTLPMGIVFELPVIIYFLSRIGIVTPRFLKQYRKHMVVVLLILAGIITPSPDIVSQLLVGVPLYLLYEIGIIVSEKVQRKKLLREKNQMVQ